MWIVFLATFFLLTARTASISDLYGLWCELFMAVLLRGQTFFANKNNPIPTGMGGWGGGSEKINSSKQQHGAQGKLSRPAKFEEKGSRL